MQLIPSLSSLSSGSERGRQYQQVLRRSHVVGAGQAGRGAQLPDVRQQTGAPSAAGPGGGCRLQSQHCCTESSQNPHALRSHCIMSVFPKSRASVTITHSHRLCQRWFYCFIFLSVLFFFFICTNCHFVENENVETFFLMKKKKNDQV